MVRFFRYPEYRHNLLGAVDHLLRNRRHRAWLPPVGHLPERSLTVAIRDAVEYLGVDVEGFFDLAERWPSLEAKLFAGHDDVQVFYDNWNDEAARSNICANILSQHLDRVNFSVLSGQFGDPRTLSGAWADFGCGTASLSLALALAGLIRAPLYLVDVENQVQDFVRFRVRKHGLTNLEVVDTRRFDPAAELAGLYCIDVLEHLPDPTAVLRKQIHPRLALGGHLYLKAPWRGQVTHIDAAPENFYRRGGRRFLGRHYRMLCRVQPMDVAALYRKVKV